MTDTINTRELIMNILLEMDREKTPCHLAVRDALDKYQFLPRQDRAFIKRVCEGTVEYGIQNDYIINQYSKIKINKCKPVIVRSYGCRCTRSVFLTQYRIRQSSMRR